VVLCGGFHPEQCQRMVWGSAEDGQQNDACPRRVSRVDECGVAIAVYAGGSSPSATAKPWIAETTVAAPEVAGSRVAGFSDVTDNDLGAESAQMVGASRIAGQDSDRQPGRTQGGDHLAAEASGPARDEDHEPVPIVAPTAAFTSLSLVSTGSR
jgi:hypothetical protein